MTDAATRLTAACAAVVVLAIGVGLAAARQPSYESHGQLAMVPATRDPGAAASVVGSFNTSGAIGTYVALAKSTDTRRRARVAGITVSAQVIPESRVIDVRTHGDRRHVEPALAAVLATTTREQRKLNDAWRLIVLQSAQPAQKVGPSWVLLLGITALLAVVAAAGVGVVLRRRADGRWGHRGPAADGRRDPGGPALQRPAAGRS